MSAIASRLPAPRPSRKRGVALMMILGAIAVIGALVVGVVFSAMLERREAMQQRLRARALAAAEVALAGTLAPTVWNSSWSTSSLHGILAHRDFPLNVVDAIDSVTIAKLSTRLFLVISDARVGLSPMAFARRRVSLIVVLDSAQHPVPASRHAWLELTR